MLAGIITLTLTLGAYSNAISSDDISFNSTTLPKLGTAYSSTESRMLGAACVRGEAEEFGGTESRFRIKNNANLESIEKTLKASLGLTLGFKERGDVIGAIDYVKNSKTTSKNTVQTLVVKFSPKPVRLATYFSALPDFRDVPMDVVAKRVKRSCGDSYVAELKYAAILVAALKVNFKSSEVKSDIGGKIKLSLTGVGDVIDIDGGVNSLTDTQKSKVAVEVSAKQLGGDQRSLSAVLPAGYMTCTLDDMTPCEVAYKSIIDYARSDMAAQFRTLEDYYPVKARTVYYEDNINLWDISDLINY
jgi:hypothetical protein